MLEPEIEGGSDEPYLARREDCLMQRLSGVR
jgi:hypothetical protein